VYPTKKKRMQETQARTTTAKQFIKIRGIFQCQLTLEDGTTFTIPMREDGYIYATKLCMIAGKRMDNWMRSPETKALIEKLEKTIPQIEETKVIEVHQGGNKYQQGTWVHPDLGIHLAQYCNPSFSIQVAKWIRELIITDEVKLGQEKSNEEITRHYETLVEELKNKIESAENIIIALSSENKYMVRQYNRLAQKHQNYLRRKEQYKLREGSCLYLMNMSTEEERQAGNHKIKIGQTGNISDRVSGFRTSSPYCQLMFLMYTNENLMLEKAMKVKYNKHLIPNNREFINDVPVDELIRQVQNIATVLNIEYTVEHQDELDRFNGNRVEDEPETNEEQEKEDEDDDRMKRCGGITHRTEESRMLPIHQFFKNKSTRDGYARLCKECYLVGVYGDRRKRRKQVVPPPFDTSTHKWCNRCEQVKPHEEYYRCQMTKDGLFSNCKACKADQKRKQKESSE